MSCIILGIVGTVFGGKVLDAIPTETTPLRFHHFVILGILVAAMGAGWWLVMQYFESLGYVPPPD